MDRSFGEILSQQLNEVKHAFSLDSNFYVISRNEWNGDDSASWPIGVAMTEKTAIDFMRNWSDPDDEYEPNPHRDMVFDDAGQVLRNFRHKEYDDMLMWLSLDAVRGI
ncbi:hypothetical protein HWB05_gp121 [Streptomyces phage BRock]|uniref:Uncharacterized protein n=1 Tax=Streptomyces phage BRock TaxID=1913591 RepID=A0A1J0GW23_9CAUD|nr:hypothetical protein HWB05_gp121 [Streptomyces phage BRock]APC46383.1 hypothetical protein [Streptomyces phage BRock]